MSNTFRLDVEGLSKKFSTNLKSSLRYGLTDSFGRVLHLKQSENLRNDEFWALDNVSFSLEEGKSLGLMGLNGSGKTTLLRILNGTYKPDRGHVKLRGNIGSLIAAGAGFSPLLTGRENIYVNATLLGMKPKDIENKFDEIVEFSELGKFIDMPVKNYSSGMGVRLGFAVATVSSPKILLVDEVLAVGDSAFQQKCHEKIEEFKHDGRTIILVSHGLGDVAQLCQTVAWIEKGHLKAIGDAYDVVGEYLGEAHDATVRQTGEIGERWGTREVEITGVEFLGLDKKPISSIRSGAPVTLRVNFHAHQQVPEIVAGFRISHLHGTNIWGTNTKRRSVHVGPVNGDGSIDIEIPEFPLLTGTYDLTIALSDASEVHSFDHWEKGLRFDVSQGKIFDEGLVTFPAHFSFHK